MCVTGQAKATDGRVVLADGGNPHGKRMLGAFDRRDRWPGQRSHRLRIGQLPDRHRWSPVVMRIDPVPVRRKGGGGISDAAFVTTDIPGNADRGRCWPIMGQFGQRLFGSIEQQWDDLVLVERGACVVHHRQIAFERADLGMGNDEHGAFDSRFGNIRSEDPFWNHLGLDCDGLSRLCRWSDREAVMHRVQPAAKTGRDLHESLAAEPKLGFDRQTGPCSGKLDGCFEADRQRDIWPKVAERCLDSASIGQREDPARDFDFERIAPGAQLFQSPLQPRQLPALFADHHAHAAPWGQIRPHRSRSGSVRADRIGNSREGTEIQPGMPHRNRPRGARAVRECARTLLATQSPGLKTSSRYWLSGNWCQGADSNRGPHDFQS